MVGMLNAPPGTRLYERMKKAGRLTGVFSGDNVDGTTNIVPKMGLDALRDGYRNMIQHIYSPKHYYERTMTFLREYEMPKTSRVHLNLQRLIAVCRSSIRLGFFGKERFHYWKILSWTIFYRPRLVSLAITLAIYGHHFRKISKLSNL